MTKPKPKPASAADAVRQALARESQRRDSELKPIEIVKLAICAYQAFHFDGSGFAGSPTGTLIAMPTGAPGGTSATASIDTSITASAGTHAPASDAFAMQPSAESDDRAGLRRGTQASVDRLLFNVNYWRAAYEDRIVAACPTPDDARACLQAACSWNSHTMKLNIMPDAEVAATFERFCPPFAVNNRRGGAGRTGAGKGPLPAFVAQAEKIAQRMEGAWAAKPHAGQPGQPGQTEQSDQAGQAPSPHPLRAIAHDMQAEAAFYATYDTASALDAYYDLLPAWCLQDRIDLVTGTWWNDVDVMQLVAERLHARFAEMGFAAPLCGYFLDAMRESIDGYTREMNAADSPFADEPIPQLVERIHAARDAHPNSETDGYGDKLPAWLAPKEQLIWNTIVCAIYGPMHARPLLVDELGLLPVEGKPARTDVITELAQRAYVRYLATRRESGISPEFDTFEKQPESLRASGLERIQSIPDKLKVLGYRIVPLASCYPEQRIERLKASEVECLAILEHRRWFDERTAAGWERAPEKDVERKHSPYLVDWDDLPDRAREWNRSSVRDIPSLLASVGLAISK